jgi:acyl carrier protein
MERSQLLDTTLSILRKYTLDASVWANFSEDMEFVKDLKIKSARLIDALLDLEDALGISIAGYEVATVRELVDSLAEQVARKKP